MDAAFAISFQLIILFYFISFFQPFADAAAIYYYYLR